MKPAKTVFILNIHSFTDVITNSSSELFVIMSSKNILTQLLRNNELLNEYIISSAKEFLNSSQNCNLLLNSYECCVYTKDLSPIEIENKKQQQLNRSIVYYNEPNLPLINFKYKDFGTLEKKYTGRLDFEINHQGQTLLNKIFQNCIFVISKHDNPKYESIEFLQQIAMLRYHI